MEAVSDIIAAKRCIGSIVGKFDYDKRELDPKKLKELKNIVKGNSSIIADLVDALFQFVRRENCDQRLAVVLICDQLFQRSHAFRVELTNSLQDWLIFTAETDPLHYPLPLPTDAANNLKVGMLRIVKAWHEKFASAYPKLANAYQFLRSSKAFDFERADAQLRIERVREEEIEQQKERKAMLVVEEVTKEISATLEDINRCLEETRNAVELLMPKFESENDDEPGPSSRSAPQNALHAYTNADSISVIVPVDAPIVQIDESNESIANSLLDCTKMLRFFNKLVLKWLARLTKFAGRSGAELVKQAIDLKSKIAIELQRCEELKLPNVERRSKRSSGSDSDEFEDVPDKEGLELDFKMPNDFLAPHEIERIRQLEAGEGTSQSASREPLVEEGQKFFGNQDSVAPVLSYGLDLKYWGEKNIAPAEVPRNNADCHRFWRPPDESDTTASDGLEVYQTRVITFVGKEERNTRQCRAPLPDGSVCPRFDKYRCPVHGIIIDRDSMGFPREELPGSSRDVASVAGADKDFVKDIEQAVGVSLTEESGSGRNKKRKGIIKKREISDAEKVRQRLSTKLFDRRALKRVSETLDAIQKARAARNFEHQFNYALSRR